MSEPPNEYDILPENTEEDVRISSDEQDDLPVSPPDMRPRAAEGFGGDADPEEETIEQRIMQEEPDPDSAYGAPRDEGGLDAPRRAGGDDPDSIPAEDDVLGDSVSLDEDAEDRDR